MTTNQLALSISAEQVDPKLNEELIRAFSFYSRALPYETGEGLRATLNNIQASIDNFIAQGVSPDAPRLLSLKRLIAEHKE